MKNAETLILASLLAVAEPGEAPAQRSTDVEKSRRDKAEGPEKKTAKKVTKSAQRLTSEQVHWIYGAAFLAGSGVLLAEESGAFHAPKLRYGVPVATMVAGGLLMIDPLLHGSAAPKNYGAETKQHLAMGGLLLAIGAVDLAHTSGRLEHWTWGLVLPAGMVAAGARLFFHAQHGDPGQHALLTTQHRILGATVAIAGVAKALSLVPDPDTDEARWPGFTTGWLLSLGLIGVELLLYTEGSPAPPKKQHSSKITLVPGGIGVAGRF